MDIDIEWSGFLNKIIDNVNPLQKTKLEIITSKRNLHWDTGLITTKETKYNASITFPKSYTGELNAIVDGLRKSGNVFVSPKSNGGCVFCGGSKSQEHILPKWFRNYFPEYSFDSMNHYVNDSNSVQSYEYGLSNGKESSYGITTYDVCVTCNTGWMSELETEVKNIIAHDSKNLKTGLQGLPLSPVNSHSLSKWLVCKALLLAIRGLILPPIEENVVRDLRDGRIAEGFLVEVHATQRFGLNYQLAVGSPFLRTSKKNEKLVANLSNNFFAAVLQIGNFCYRVSYWAHESDYPRISIFPNTFSIYPYHAYLNTSDIPQPSLEDINSNSYLKIFLSSIGLGDKESDAN